MFRAVVELSSSTCTDIHAAAQAVLHNITVSNFPFFFGITFRMYTIVEMHCIMVRDV